MSPATAARRRFLRKVITERRVASQRELVDTLEKNGFPVTQATVSRDLDAIGADKLRAENGTYHYGIISSEGADGATIRRLQRAVSDFAISIDVSVNLVVVHTPPGAAHLVAGAVDAAELPGVLGTVAGDDTLIVVASPDSGGAVIATELERIGAGR